MKLLAVGFDRAAQERLSAALSGVGHQVLAATGQVSARTLARAGAPEALVIPGGPAGEAAASWVADLLPGLRAFVLPADADPGEVVAMVGPAPGGQPTPRASASSQPSLTPPPGLGAESAGPASTAVAAAPSMPSPAPRRLADERDDMAARLAAKLADVRFGDYHAILGTSEGASPAIVREQHARLSRLYTPSGWPVPVGPDDIAQLEEIGRGLADAFTIMDDPQLRARYERALESAGRRPAAGPWR
ncbi:MAG: hypothetical protein H6744_15370 [Deltaproteobacteria bacterium]|nr:hypothetical protein [Deltaproteobacteria bacterium]